MIRWHVHLHYMYLYNVSFQKVCRMWIILASSARGWDVHRKCCRDNNYRAGRALMAPALWTGHYCRTFHSGEISSNNFGRFNYFHIFNACLNCLPRYGKLISQMKKKMGSEEVYEVKVDF